MSSAPFTSHSFSPLNVTKQSRERIFVGLGWDPNESEASGLAALLHKLKKHHDLDLSCYFYNKKKEPIGFVSADSKYHANASGTIYHSGDNEEGIGDGDDEQISVELKTLPDDIHHLIFKASIKSGHSFDEINSPEIRLCDGYTNRCFLNARLDQKHDATGKKHDAFVFAQLKRIDSGWAYRDISIFLQNTDPVTWQGILQDYL